MNSYLNESFFLHEVDRKLSSTPSVPESNSSESFSGLHDTEHKGQHKDCPACRKTLEILRRHRQQKSPQLGMFSLPRENEAYEVEREGRKSYFPGRNLPNIPFRQYTPDGLSKREYLPQKTVEVGETPSDEVRLSNWGNLQHGLTAKNLDDMAQDILALKASMQEEKEKIAEVSAKLELVQHLLADSEAIKKMITRASENIMTRINKMEELTKKASTLGTKVTKPSPAILALAAEGYKRKDKAKLERSFSFGMMNTEETDNRPEYDFGKSDVEYRILLKWVTAIKGLPPCLSEKTIQKILSLVPPEPESVPAVQPESPIAQSEPVIDLSMLSTNVLGSSSGVKK